MASRIELQTKLEEILGSRNVYFQPPASLRMNYPAIVYKLSGFKYKNANNSKYDVVRSYTVTLIDSDHESRFLNDILRIPYCSFDRQFISDNLYHFTFTLYF